MDVEIFKFSQAFLEENSEKSNLESVKNPFLQSSLEIYKNFEFDSALQRMSVLFSYNGKNYLSTKGSPEALKSLLNPRTIPENYDSMYKKYSFAGYRLIAFGIKEVIGPNINVMKREDLEKEIDFLGIL